MGKNFHCKVVDAEWLLKTEADEEVRQGGIGLAEESEDLVRRSWEIGDPKRNCGFDPLRLPALP